MESPSDAYIYASKESVLKKSKLVYLNTKTSI